MVKIDKDKLAKEIMGKRKPIKIKRKRKPMSEEQRAAAAERLKKARELRAEKNGPSKNKTYHSSVYNNEMVELKEVLKWLKTAKEQASSYKQSTKLGLSDSKQRAKNTTMYNLWEGYATDINWYLRTGDWISDYFGEYMGQKTNWVVVAAGATSELMEGDTWNIDSLKKIDDTPITKKRRLKRKRNETE